MKKTVIKIKLYYFKVLYVLLDRLSDISFVHKYFVRKKIYVGAAIISLSLSLSLCTSPSYKSKEKGDVKASTETRTCYLVMEIKDSTKATKDSTPQQKKAKVKIKPLEPEDLHIMCYEVLLSPDSIENIVPRDFEEPDLSELKDSGSIADNKFLFVDERPYFFSPGSDSLQRFIYENLRYPKDALEMGISGRVVVRFKITTKGEVANPKVIRSVCTSIDEEAIRLVKLMPKWVPAPWEAEFTLPIIFNLPE